MFFVEFVVSLSNLIKSPPAPPSSFKSVQKFLKSSSPVSLSKSLLNFLKPPTVSLAEVLSSSLCLNPLDFLKSPPVFPQVPSVSPGT